MNYLYVPFILQGGAMFVDEFYFHEKRGLALWEKLGHPLDTLTVTACYSYLLWGAGDLTTYLGLSIFSCLFITKDEFVHAEVCPPLEHWLHALLFILHPTCFLAAYYLAAQGEHTFLGMQVLLTVVFFMYQVLRWSVRWRLKKQ